MILPRTIFEFKNFCRRVVALTASAAITFTPAMTFSLPQGGVVVGGNASIAGNGSSLTITQQTDRAVIDWRGFDMDENETTRFVQPNANSLAVNRVNSNSPSVIGGKLSANGNVMIINSNGMVFSDKATVDVNGLIASTADAGNAELMKNGKLSLNKPGNPNAAIINKGTLTAKDGGRIGLLAPNIVNDGAIIAKLGQVNLVSGDTATVDFTGDGLIEAAVSDKVKSQLIENNGIIAAQGGSIAITAAAGDRIVDSLINLNGALDAKTAGGKRGKIQVSGKNSRTIVSGSVDASGRNRNEAGGSITITGKQVRVKSGARMDASGDRGGGEVKLGGDYQGKGSTANATTTQVEQGAQIDANAITHGDGGKVIVWADDTTTFGGNISAVGGALGGNGGFVETSGKQTLNTTGKVNASAVNGNAGTWLLDPDNLTISNAVTSNAGASPAWAAGAGGGNVATADIVAALSGGTNVDLTASGRINVNSNISTNTYNGTVGLTLSAGQDVVISNGVSITASGNTRLNTTLRANTAGGGGAIFMDSGSAINSNGGDIIMGGGAGAITAATFNADGSVNTAATGFAVGDSGYYSGITLQNSSLNAGGGNIIMNGQGYITNAGNIHGIVLYGGTVQTSGSGNITLSGIGGSNGANVTNIGVYIHSGEVVKTTGTGSLYVTGTGGNAGGTGTDNSGVYVTSNNGLSATGSGNIVIQGTGGNNAVAGYGGNSGINIYANVAANGGNIVMNGTGGSTGSYNGGVTVSGGTVSNTGNGAITIKGQGNGAGGGGRGVMVLYGGVLSTVAGAINLIADSLTSNAIAFKDIMNIVSTSGNITLTSAKDINFYNSGTQQNELFGGPGYSGNITFNADTITNSNTPTIQTTGTMTFAPYSVGANAGLVSGGGMIVDQATMNNITAPTVNIGRTDGTGLLTIGTYNWGSALTNLNLYMGGANGGITTAGNITKASGGDASLLLKAGGNISMSTGSIASTSGKLNTTLWADSDNSGGGAILLSRGITSNNGNITLAGGLDNGANGGIAGDNIPDGYATGVAGNIYGVRVNGATVDSGTGSIKLNGNGWNNAATSDIYGAYISNAGILQSTSGNIAIKGIGGNGTSWNNGVRLGGVNSKVTTSTGAISISGTAGNSTADYGYGILLDFGTLISSTGTGSAAGTIAIQGQGASVGAQATGIGFYSSSISTIDGAVNLTGTGGASGGNGMLFYGTNNILSTGLGTITLTGTRAGGYGDIVPSNYVGFTNTIGGPSAKGAITFNTDTLSTVLNGGLSIQTTGAVNIVPRSIGTSVGIAGVAGVLGVSTALMNTITAGQLNIGRSDGTGAVSVAGNTWNTNTKIFTGTTGISFSGAQNAGTNTFTIDGNINGFYNLDITAGTIGFTGSIGNSTALNNVTLNALSSLALPSITASTIFARASGASADITIAAGKTLSASGAGTPLTLVAGRNLVNNGGTGALLTPAGRWLLFAATDGGTTGGLAPGFTKYGCPYATPCAYPATGSGLLYASTPGSGGFSGGGTSLPVLDTTGPNPPITFIPAVVTPSVPPVIPVVIPPELPAPVPAISSQTAMMELPATVEFTSQNPEFTLPERGVAAGSDKDRAPYLRTRSTPPSQPQTGVTADSESESTDSSDQFEGRLFKIDPRLAKQLNMDQSQAAF